MSLLITKSNELKAISKLAFAIGKIIEMKEELGLNVDHYNERSGFIFKCSDESVYCDNIFIFDNNGTPINLFCPLKGELSNYPALFIYKDSTYYCFTEKGIWAPYCNLFKC